MSVSKSLLIIGSGQRSPQDGYTFVGKLSVSRPLSSRRLLKTVRGRPCTRRPSLSTTSNPLVSPLRQKPRHPYHGWGTLHRCVPPIPFPRSLPPPGPLPLRERRPKTNVPKDDRPLTPRVRGTGWKRELSSPYHQVPEEESWRSWKVLRRRVRLLGDLLSRLQQPLLRYLLPQPRRQPYRFLFPVHQLPP